MYLVGSDSCCSYFICHCEKVVQMDWKTKFKKDIKTKFKHALLEFKKYKKTNQLIYLQQACNKLFSVVENYLMLKYKKRVRSYKRLREIINNKDKDLLFKAVQLHYFYYNSDLQMSRYEAEDGFQVVYRQMKSLLGGNSG